MLRKPACDMSNGLNCSRPPVDVTICGLLELYFKHCTSGTVSINISFICGILLCWSVRINTLWIFKHISAAGVASNLPRWHSHLCLRSCSAHWSQVWSAENLSWRGARQASVFMFLVISELKCSKFMLTFKMICLFPTQPAAPLSLPLRGSKPQSVAVNTLTFLHTQLLMYSFFKFPAVPRGLCFQQDWEEVVTAQWWIRKKRPGSTVTTWRMEKQWVWFSHTLFQFS